MALDFAGIVGALGFFAIFLLIIGILLLIFSIWMFVDAIKRKKWVWVAIMAITLFLYGGGLIVAIVYYFAEYNKKRRRR